jgi:hypothetical protein
MASKTGPRIGVRQDDAERTTERAQAECEFSDKLYELMISYQERFFADKSNRQWKQPLTAAEKVGQLNLPLSRLYNQIWATIMGFQEKGKPRKKMEVAA